MLIPLNIPSLSRVFLASILFSIICIMTINSSWIVIYFFGYAFKYNSQVKKDPDFWDCFRREKTLSSNQRNIICENLEE